MPLIQNFFVREGKTIVVGFTCFLIGFFAKELIEKKK